MSKVIVCGIRHHTRRLMSESRIMNTESTRLFSEKVLPGLTGKVLILFEGCRGIWHPGTSEHGGQLRKFDQPLQAKLATFVLAGADPRVAMPHARKQRMVDRMREVVLWQENIEFKDIPFTVAELEQRIANDSFEYRLKAEMPATIKEAVRTWRMANESFDAAYIQAARDRLAQYDTIAIIAGTSHAYKMSADTGWELQTCWSGAAREVVDVYLAHFCGYKLSFE